VIPERGGSEAALVTQRVHKILEGIIARRRQTRSGRQTVIVMRTPLPIGSVFVMKHGRTSLKVVEIRSIRRRLCTPDQRR
jgi:hypothetical protein